MSIKKLNEKDNPLLSRKEFKFEYVFDSATPSNDKVMGELCKLTGGNKEVCVIKNIEQKYGCKIALVTFYVYTSKEEKDRIEVKGKKQIEAEKKAAEEAAKKAEEEKAAAEAPKEEVKEEAPKEEVKEEKKDGEEGNKE
jgi:ribosomal protein S24E